MKKGLIISVILNVILLVTILFVACIKTDYAKRLWSQMVGEVYVPERQDINCVQSWNNCIAQLSYDADVVFFGNSITAGGDWQKAFPEHKVVNLGYIGEDVKGMIRRVPAIMAVHPEKVFLMAGINGLKNQELNDFEFWYSALVDSIMRSVPDVSLYLESILPVTRTSLYCSNEKIREANAIIQQIAVRRDLKYIDLYSAYAVDGNLPEDWSYDGLHLNADVYQCWYDMAKSYVELK